MRTSPSVLSLKMWVHHRHTSLDDPSPPSLIRLRSTKTKFFTHFNSSESSTKRWKWKCKFRKWCAAALTMSERAMRKFNIYTRKELNCSLIEFSAWTLEQLFEKDDEEIFSFFYFTNSSAFIQYDGRNCMQSSLSHIAQHVVRYHRGKKEAETREVKIENFEEKFFFRISIQCDRRASTIDEYGDAEQRRDNEMRNVKRKFILIERLLSTVKLNALALMCFSRFHFFALVFSRAFKKKSSWHSWQRRVPPEMRTLSRN